jgi:hypothetical protein
MSASLAVRDRVAQGQDAEVGFVSKRAAKACMNKGQ